MDKKNIYNMNQLQYNYDNFSDVLYVSFGKPKKAISVETDDGFLMRYDPFTDKLVGVTIIDFRQRFFKKRRLNIKGFIKQELPRIVSTQN